MSYATLGDLQSYLGAPPEAGDDRLLARASETIDAALIASIYPVDSLGAPTAAIDIEALMRACCAQVESWKATGDERGDGDQWQEMQLGPAKLVRTPKGSTMTTTGVGVARLAPRAKEILVVAGLLPGKPRLA